MNEIKFQNDEMERVTLASLVTDFGKMFDVLDVGLSDVDFVNPHNRALWRVMREAYRTGKPFDLLIAMNALNGKFDGVAAWCAHLTDGLGVTWDTHQTKHYAIALRELTMRREGLDFANIVRERYADTARDVVEVHSEIVGMAAQIGQRLAARPQHIGRLSVESESRYHDVRAGNITPALMWTPFSDLNAMLSPIERGQMIVVAAREKSGKTRFMLQTLTHAAIEGLKVLYISCEMQSGALVRTAAQMLARVPASGVQMYQLSPNDERAYFAAHARLRATNFWVEDHTRDIDSIRNLCLKVKHSEGLDVIAVDYLTKIQGDARFKTRQQQIAHISSTLAYLAIECDSSLWLGSQVNAEGNTREAMDTQQDADKIIKLNRTTSDGELVGEAALSLTQREGISFGAGYGKKLRFHDKIACYENIADEGARQMQFTTGENDKQDKTNAQF